MDQYRKSLKYGEHGEMRNSAEMQLPESYFEGGFSKVQLLQSDYYPSWQYPDHASIRSLTTKYVSEFSVKVDGGGINDAGGFNLIPFDDSVVGFFNRDVAHAMAEAEWAMRSDSVTIYQKVYALENAIARHCSCWEYLFQIISVHLQLEDSFYATRDGLRQVLGQAVYDQELIPVQHGYHVDYYGRSHSESLRIIKDLKKRFDFVNPRFDARAFFKHMKNYYGFSGWLQEVKKLFRDSHTGRVREYRNTFSHVHGLSSVAFIDDRRGPTRRVAINGSRLDPVDVAKMWKTLERSHSNLERAIQIVRTAILQSDHPNSKQNEDVEFRARQVKCLHCDVSTFVPLPDRLPGIDGRVYCQNCGWWPREDEMMDMGNVVDINEVVWQALIGDRLRSMRGREDLLRASLDAAG